MGLGDALRRIFLGRKLRSSQLGATLLPKRLALPVFASDALSSVAYAPDEIFIMLALAGASAYVWTWQVAVAVALLMLVVIASYRQNVQAYPGGGGDYEIAKVNLGPAAGMTVASALLVDYVLTVAVSISAGVHNAAAALPFIAEHEATYAVLLVVGLAAVNLRGLKGSAVWFAVPTYGFIVAVAGMGLWGLLRWQFGELPAAESAELRIIEAEGYEGAITTVALFFLLARAFSSGCVALTGVEAISTGVPAFRRPKSRNAATTLLMLGLLSIGMMMTIISLAREMRVKYVDPLDKELLVGSDGTPVGPDHQQNTIIAQIARGVFDNFDPAFYFVIAMTATILVLAANTAFNGFPALASILARDGYMPRQLGARGDRLAYSNGILFLAVMSSLLVIAFDAQVTRLIQLYIVGVFVSFTVSQFGMVRHWTPAAAVRVRAAGTSADAACPGAQRPGPGDDGRRAAGGGGDEVPRRRLDRDPRDGHVLHGDAVDPRALRLGRA